MGNRSKIVLTLAAMVVAFASASLTQAAPAECRPGSPTNAAGSCETNGNDTRCGTNGTATPAGPRVFAAANHVELCSEDGGSVPVEGRIGGGQQCQCVYADGGNDNPGAASGWARIDAGGLHCANDNSGPSYNSDAGGGPEACG